MHSFISSWILIFPSVYNTSHVSQHSISLRILCHSNTLDLHNNFTNLINLVYSFFVLLHMRLPLEVFATQVTHEFHVLIYLNKSPVYLLGEMFPLLCLNRFFLCVNFESHLSQSNLCSPQWILCWWISSDSLLLNDFSHCSQDSRWALVCCLSTWYFKSLLLLNFLVHSLQPCGPFPSWTASSCLLQLLGWSNILRQTAQVSLPLNAILSSAAEGIEECKSSALLWSVQS